MYAGGADSYTRLTFRVSTVCKDYRQVIGYLEREC